MIFCLQKKLCPLNQFIFFIVRRLISGDCFQIKCSLCIGTDVKFGDDGKSPIIEGRSSVSLFELLKAINGLKRLATIFDVYRPSTET